MTKQELEARVKILEDEITRLKDVEEIDKLQNIYGYYLEHWEYENIIDLFYDSPDTYVEVSDNGVCLGMEEIRNFFKALGNPPPEFLHIMMQVQGVIDVDPGGITAKGRYYGFGILALPMETGETRPFLSHGIYENEYIKDNGKWKFKKLHWHRTFLSPYEDGWVKTPVIPSDYAHKDKGRSSRPPSHYKPYPSGEIIAYHYKNPVSGR